MILTDSRVMNMPVGRVNIDGTEMIITTRKKAGFTGIGTQLLFIIVNKNEKGKYQAETCWYTLCEENSRKLEKYTGFRFNELIILDDWKDYTDVFQEMYDRS